MKVYKAFKYRIYPNREQQQKLAVRFGHTRYVYNLGLAQSQDRYSGYNRLAEQPLILKASEEMSWLREAHSQVLQQSLQNLDRAFRNFFDKRGGFPHFKSKRARQSIRYPQPGEMDCTRCRYIYLPKVGQVSLVVYRSLEGVLKNVTVSRTKSGKYFVSFQVEVEIEEPALVGSAVGIDLRLLGFITLSTREKIVSPQYYRKAQEKRRRLVRHLSRKKLGSCNREKARLRLARLDKRIINHRCDFHHKLSRRLVEENRFIGLKDLNVRGMITNRHLAKSIGDVGWSAFIGMLNYEGDRELICFSDWQLTDSQTPLPMRPRTLPPSKNINCLLSVEKGDAICMIF